MLQSGLERTKKIPPAGSSGRRRIVSRWSVVNHHQHKHKLTVDILEDNIVVTVLMRMAKQNQVVLSPQKISQPNHAATKPAPPLPSLGDIDTAETISAAPPEFSGIIGNNLMVGQVQDHKFQPIANTFEMPVNNQNPDSKKQANLLGNLALTKEHLVCIQSTIDPAVKDCHEVISSTDVEKPITSVIKQD